MEKRALLVIDVQKYFINRYTQHIPEKIADFIKKNNNRFDYILFFKFLNSWQSNWVKISDWTKMFKSPEIDIVPELNQFVNKNNMFTKTAFSCFKAKGFADFVRNKKINDLYLCGLDTHACIYCTAMEAYELGFNIHVIADLCAASHGLNYHLNSLKALKRNLGDKIIINSTTKII